MKEGTSSENNTCPKNKQKQKKTKPKKKIQKKKKKQEKKNKKHVLVIYHTTTVDIAAYVQRTIKKITLQTRITRKWADYRISEISTI